MAEADEKDGNASEGVDDGYQLLNKIFTLKKNTISAYFAPLSLWSLIPISDGGYQDDGVEQRARKCPLHLLLVLTSIPAFNLHCLDDLFFKFFHLGLHHPRPVVLS